MEAAGASETGSRLVRIVYPDHHTVIGDSLWACVQAKRGTDWTLRCGERSVEAHRLILDLFLTPEKLDVASEDPAVRPNGTPEGEYPGVGNLDSLLEFLYRGEVTLPEEYLEGLRQTAGELDLHVLVEAVETAVAAEREPAVARRNNLGRGGHRRRGIGRTSSPADGFRFSGRGTRHSAGWYDELEVPGKSENDSDCGESDGSDRWDQRVKNMKMEPAEELVAMDSDDGNRLCQRIIRSVGPQSEDEDCGDEVKGVGKKKSAKKPESQGSPSKTKSEKDSNYGESDSSDHWDQRVKNIKMEPAEELVAMDSDDGDRLCEGIIQSVGLQSKDEDCANWCATPEVKGVGKRKSAKQPESQGSPPATKFKCDQCEYESLRSGDMRRHQLSTHLKLRPFKCSHCSFEASRVSTLKRHVEVVHELGPNRFPCETCGKRCHSQAALVLHVRSHTKEKPFLCQRCPSAFSRDDNLKNHVDVVHGPAGSRRFVCETCGKQCATHSKLICHGRSHTKEKPFKCPHCSHASGRQIDLKKHVEVVHQMGDSHFSCKTCGKRCGSKTMLGLHQRTHTQEKPYKCSHCSYATAQNGSLKNHVDVVHGLGTSRFTCDTCGKRCPSRSELAMHVKTHTKEKPFKCQMCSYACSHSSNLRKHLKKVHEVTTFGPEVTTAGLTVDQ